MNLPSVKTLAAVFGDKAKEARRILEMTRAQLEALPACADRIAECYHPPKTYDLRLTALNALAGTYGVESFRVREGGMWSYCEYLNAGDAYAPTLLRFQGRYRVGCWGDIAEGHFAVHVI